MSKMMSRSFLQDTGIDSCGADGRRTTTEADTNHSAGGFDSRHSALADLMSNHLRSNGLRQIDFCRQVGFDQGLLSKILSSVVNTLNVETALKLAEGMNLPPRVVFEAIGKSDVHEMLVRVYAGRAGAA
jgi:hypothetical protein